MRIHSACVSKVDLLHECHGYDPGTPDQARSAPIMFTPTGREVPSNEVTVMNEQHPAIDALSTSFAETTEEAVINALYTAHSIDGRDGHRLEALPLDATLAILQRYRVDVSTSPNYPSIGRS